LKQKSNTSNETTPSCFPFNLTMLIFMHSDRNAIARIQNSHMQSSSDSLTPLVNTTTGAPIVGMPLTSDAINHMTGKNT